MSSVGPSKNFWSLFKASVVGTPKKKTKHPRYELCLGFTALKPGWVFNAADVSAVSAEVSCGAGGKAFVALTMDAWIKTKCAWRSKEVLEAVMSDPKGPTKAAFKKGWSLFAHTAVAVKENGRLKYLVTLYSKSDTPVGELLKVHKISCEDGDAWLKEYSRYTWKSVGQPKKKYWGGRKLEAAFDQLIRDITGRNEQYELGSFTMGLRAFNCQTTAREFILRLIENPVDADLKMAQVAGSVSKERTAKAVTSVRAAKAVSCGVGSF